MEEQDTSTNSANNRPSRKPPLHRNQACTACKRKKRKCDAVRPVCSPCAASARLYQEEPQCEYTTTSSRSVGPGNATVTPNSLSQSQSLHPTTTSDATHDGHIPGGICCVPAHFNLAGSQIQSSSIASDGSDIKPSIGESRSRKHMRHDDGSHDSDNFPRVKVQNEQVEVLQARISELERALQDATARLTLSESPVSSNPPSLSPPGPHPLQHSHRSDSEKSNRNLTYYSGYNGPTQSLHSITAQDVGTKSASSSQSPIVNLLEASVASDPGTGQSFIQTGFLPDAQGIIHQAYPEQYFSSPDIRQVFWNAWPNDLPPLSVVQTLAGAALNIIASTLFILPVDNFLSALVLPPTDARFPSVALLHALCALGSTMIMLPPEGQHYWKEPNTSTPAAYHFRKAKKHLHKFNINTVLDNARAALLLTVYSFATEEFVEVWQLVGLAARSLAPAGLNHVQNNCALPSNRIALVPGHFLRKPTFLPPPVDDFEVFYRSTTLWQVFMCDVWMGACSGWSVALSLEDITALLPVWPSETSPLDVVLGQSSLDPHSPTFFSEHLESPILSLHLSIKSMILFSKVVHVLQRSSLPGTTLSIDAKRKLRESQAFQDVLALLDLYTKCFPASCREPIRPLPNGRLDAALLNAHIVPHVAKMLLFEPFILGDDDEGFIISVRAAQEVYKITRSIYMHSQDQISYYHTPINYCWMVTSRVLIRAMRYRNDRKDVHGAAIFRSQIHFLLARITPLSTKSPLVGSCLNMVNGLYTDESAWHRG